MLHGNENNIHTVIRQQGNTIGFLADHLNLGTTFMLFTSFVFIYFDCSWCFG